MDPITISLAVGVASKAFDAIKSGFAMGRDLEQMSGDIGRWMGAASDVDQAEKQAKNPGVFGKVFGGGSIEATALQAYSAKKKLEEQRYELKMFLNLTHGPQAYDELLQMEGKIRKERQETIYKQQQLRKQIGEAIGWLFLVLVIGVMLLALASVFSSKAYGKELTHQQKVNQGIIKEPKYTMCLRKKMIAYKGGLACVYRGAGRTFEIEFTDVQTSCPRKYKCVYNPNGTEPNIDDVMKSLRDIAK
jgi:tetrahydromethanopterin S-methyltransferase subunit G